MLDLQKSLSKHLIFIILSWNFSFSRQNSPSFTFRLYFPFGKTLNVIDQLPFSILYFVTFHNNLYIYMSCVLGSFMLMAACRRYFSLVRIWSSPFSQRGQRSLEWFRLSYYCIADLRYVRCFQGISQSLQTQQTHNYIAVGKNLLNCILLAHIYQTYQRKVFI